MKKVYSLQSTVYRKFNKTLSKMLCVVAIVFVLLVTFHLSLVTVYAHILKTDGTIGAVLHIDPEDDPVINEPATFYFEFKDTKGKFKILNCECFVSISSSQRQIYSARMGPIYNEAGEITSANNSSFGVIFPQKDLYNIVITGKSVNQNDFPPFKLSYDLRVTRETKPTNPQTTQTPSWISTHLVQVLAGGAVLIFFAGMFITRRFAN